MRHRNACEASGGTTFTVSGDEVHVTNGMTVPIVVPLDDLKEFFVWLTMPDSMKETRREPLPGQAEIPWEPKP